MQHDAAVFLPGYWRLLETCGLKFIRKWTPSTAFILKAQSRSWGLQPLTWCKVHIWSFDKRFGKNWEHGSFQLLWVIFRPAASFQDVGCGSKDTATKSSRNQILSRPLKTIKVLLKVLKSRRMFPKKLVTGGLKHERVQLMSLNWDERLELECEHGLSTGWRTRLDSVFRDCRETSRTVKVYFYHFILLRRFSGLSQQHGSVFSHSEC